MSRRRLSHSRCLNIDMTTPGNDKKIVPTAGWMAHWALRVWLAAMLLIYGWSKVFLMQFGLADWGDALTTFGEMSPMGLLWRFMAYSPVVQVLAGVAEVAAAALLLFRRTAWLGGLLAAADMAVVFLLNLTFDVPVKQLSGLMCLAGLIVAVPWFVHIGRILIGAPVAAAKVPHPIPWPRVDRITRWLGVALAVVMVGASGVAMGRGIVTAGGIPPIESDLPGVYQVVQDTAAPAPQLVDDQRWQQVAFGQHNNGTATEPRGRIGLRLANGDFYDGTYTLDGQHLTVELYPVREGDQGLVRDVERTLDLTWERTEEGIHLQGPEVDLVIAEDPEFRYLFDRGFHWAPGTPINR